MTIETVGRCAAGALLAGLLAAASARAEVLVVPGAVPTLLAPIAAARPDCAEPGFLPCGSADVRYGKRFAATAMQREPPCAYLLARAPVSGELVPLLPARDREAVVEGLYRRFAELRLAS